MISLGTLSAFEDVQALIKSKVGDFLVAEQKLRQLQNNPAASIRAKAVGLLTIHSGLEKELGTAQEKVAQFQTGAWTFSDVISLGDLGQRLLSHLKDVSSLEKEASGVVDASSIIPDSTAPVLGTLALAAAVYYFFLRK